MKTKVIFLIEKDCFVDGINIGAHVFAYMPYEDWDREGNKTSYAHIGQHSSCHPDYAKECKEAKYNEYYDLLKELISIGYNLEILNEKQVIEYHRPPTQYELKFGEGATHYRCFLVNQIIKKTGEFKKWFIASDDKLRYYYL